MEKATIGCNYNSPSSLSSSVTMSNIAKAQEDMKSKPSLLRRVSQSDPHLDIPHFLNAQEKSFNSFHHVLSGLIEGNSSLKVNKQGLSTETVNKTDTMPSSPDLTQKAPAAGLDRNKSALELSNFVPSSTTGGLRKVASIANYNLSHRSAESSHPSTPPNAASNWPLSQHFSHLNTGQHTSSHHNINTIPEDQGLMMSVRPTSGLAANALNTTGVCARTGIMESASAMAGSTTSSPPRSGVFGVFGRGFLAKPVIRSDEENYRYIMALDR